MPNLRALEIERIYVDAQYRSQGVGKAFLNMANEMARVCDAEYIWLGVWEFNHAARIFYEKQGYVVTGRRLFTLGADEQTDLIMRKELV